MPNDIQAVERDVEHAPGGLWEKLKHMNKVQVAALGIGAATLVVGFLAWRSMRSGDSSNPLGSAFGLPSGVSGGVGGGGSGANAPAPGIISTPPGSAPAPVDIPIPVGAPAPTGAPAPPPFFATPAPSFDTAPTDTTSSFITPSVVNSTPAPAPSFTPDSAIPEIKVYRKGGAIGGAFDSSTPDSGRFGVGTTPYTPPVGGSFGWIQAQIHAAGAPQNQATPAPTLPTTEPDQPSEPRRRGLQAS